MIKRGAILAALVAVLAIAFHATAASASPGGERGARAALAHAEDVLAGDLPPARRNATLALLDLRQRLGALSRPERKRASALFARPTDNGVDRPTNPHYNRREAKPVCGPNFCVHYVTKGKHAPSLEDADGNGVPDYVDSTLSYLEQVYVVEHETLGWPAIVSDGNAGGNRRSDAYLADIPLFGYATSDRGEPRGSGYLVLDDDYKEFRIYHLAPEIALRTTIAHEFNHVLQFTYRAVYESWAFEATASWMELKVFPEDNSPIGLSAFARETALPLTSGTPRETTKIYGSFIFLLHLDHQFGPEVVRRMWELSKAAKQNPSLALDRAIAAAGGGGFETQFGLFSAAVAEYKAANTGFLPEVQFLNPRPDIRRLDRLGPGDAVNERMDHATFAMFDVRARGDVVTAKAKLPRGVPGGLALVGLEGSVVGGTATVESAERPKGGRVSVTLTGATQFSRITAVIVNSSIAQRGYDRRLGDYAWNDDNARVSLSID